jgi:hypothetical protein
MAKLKAFQRDTAALEVGVWINPDPEFSDIELLVKGRDAAYYDKYTIAIRDVVRRAKRDGTLQSNQSLNDLPPSTRDSIENEVMLQHYVLGVRNLEDDEGLVKIADFRKMAMTEQFRPLLSLAQTAFLMATERRAADREEVLGNSEPSRPTSSRGVAQKA